MSLVLNLFLFQICCLRLSSSKLWMMSKPVKQMVSNFQRNLKDRLRTGAVAFPVQAATTIIVRFINLTSFVTELVSDVDTEAELNRLLLSGNLFHNVTRVWLQDRARGTRW